MRVTALHLSAAALVCLGAAGIADVDQLGEHPATDLAYNPLIGPMELYEIVCRLSLPNPVPRFPSSMSAPGRREREMFRLHLVEGVTLPEIARRAGVSAEGVCYLLNDHFGLSCTPPSVNARRQQRHREA
jgi:AraC-like DNA-binding protein